jgi:hypothetical protein
MAIVAAAFDFPAPRTARIPKVSVIACVGEVNPSTTLNKGVISLFSYTGAGGRGRDGRRFGSDRHPDPRGGSS